MSGRPLTAKARAFADSWAGPGTGVHAARAAGYRGTDRVLGAEASKHLHDPRIRARIVARVGSEQFAAWTSAPAELEPIAPPQPSQPLVKGKGRGTATERIEVAMSIVRNKRETAKDRLAAIRLAAELEGELRGAGGRRSTPRVAAPAPTPASATPAPAAPSADAPEGLRLIYNRKDGELAKA